MKRVVMRLVAWFALLAGCAKPLPPPKIGDLHFPVIVIYANSSIVTYGDATDLGTMNVAHVRAAGDVPVLIDSQFAIYTLENLRSTHNSLWHMLHPTGVTPVTFNLQRVPKSGLELARERFRLQLEKKTWLSDLDARRQALAKARDLGGMTAALRESAD